VLTRQHRQEALSRAYIQAVAALAGMSVTWKTTDYGVDLSLNQIKQRGRRLVEAGVQLDDHASRGVLDLVDRLSACHRQ